MSCSLVISQMTWLCIFMVALVTLFIVFKYINQYKKKTTNWINYTKRAFSCVSSLVNYQTAWCCTFKVALITLFHLRSNIRLTLVCNINQIGNWMNYTERPFSRVTSLVISQMMLPCTFVIALITLFILEKKY